MADLRRTTMLGIFLILTILTVNNVVQETAANKDVPLSKISQNIGGPTMKFLYCYSCGYRKVFEDYVGIIQQKYPEITINGANYDPPGFNMYLSRFVSIAKMLLILCILVRFNIFQHFGQVEPGWWTWCLDNKMYSCMMVFFLSNMLEGQLVSSGAFEISINDVPVWSKLETGRIPQPPELFQIIDNHMQFTGKVEFNPEFVK